MLSNFPGFLAIATFVIVLPGQDTAITIRNTLVGGRKGGAYTVFGIVSALVIWSIATSAGLAALLLASHPIFTAIKVAGVAYLMLLGLKALRSAVRPDWSEPSESIRASSGLSPRACYRQGALSSLGNVKLGIFFTSLLPQFVTKGPGTFGVMLALGLLFTTMTLFWLLGYTVAVAKAGDFLRRPKIRRSLDAVVGTVLIGFGVRLATARG